MNHQRIDNFLPREIFEDLQKDLMGGNFPWFYRHAMTDPQDTEGFLFATVIVNNEEVNDTGMFQEIGVPIVSRIPMTKLIRMKINCHPRQTLRGEENYPKCRYHVDMNEQHTVGILSINTCNGYTELEDGTKLESIENSLVIFNGDIKHRSVGQTDENIRVNINIDWIE